MAAGPEFMTQGIEIPRSIRFTMRHRVLLQTWLLAGAVGLAGSTVSLDARPQEKNACLEAYASAQRLQREEKFLEARKQMRTCARPACPSFVQADCTRWLDDVQSATPSVVLSASTPNGKDVADVHVAMDGRPLTTRLEGKAVELDPGVHVFSFESAGYQPAEKQAVVKTAEKNRSIEVVLTPLGGGAGGRSSGEGSEDGAASGEDETIPTEAYVVGAVGLIGWAGFTFSALRLEGQVHDLNQCSPSCPQSDVDDASRTRNFAFISLGVAVIASGVTAYLILDRPESTPSTEPTVGFMVLPQGAAAAVTGTF